MFARVITIQAEAGVEGVEKVVQFAEKQLPGAEQRPGFRGFYLLADEESGKVINISLWETREQMEAVSQGTPSGIHKAGVEQTGLTSMHLETYEVKIAADGLLQGQLDSEVVEGLSGAE